MVKRKKNNTQGPQLIRLNKYLADAGITSRRKADELIADGKVRVNGKKILDLGTKVTKADQVTVNGDPVSYFKKDIYIILNKPKDVISTVDDEKGRKKVTDLINTKERVFPVGRLDRNTTGLLLFTNDGELANRLMHPRYEVPRLYNAGLDKELRFDDAEKIAKGVKLEDGITAPCEVFIDPSDRKMASLILTEGKNHEIKRMFERFGYKVKKLDRKEYATLSTSGLNRGRSRHLNKREITELKKSVGLK